MSLNVRCYESAHANRKATPLAISDEIKIDHPEGTHYLTLCLEGSQFDVVISNYRNLPDACEAGEGLDVTKREIRSTPIEIYEFSVSDIVWETHVIYTSQTNDKLAPVKDIICSVVDILQQPGFIHEFTTKASAALVANLENKISDTWKNIHELSESRSKARLLALHLPSVKARKNIQTKSGPYIEFGRGMGVASDKPSEEALDELFARGVSDFHIEMMNRDCAWFGLKLVSGCYFHGVLSGKNLEIKVTEEIDA